MDNKQAKNFVKAVYHDIWAANDLKKFDEYYHPQAVCVVYQPDGTELEMDYATLKSFAHSMAKARRNVETVFEEVLAQRNKIIARFKQRSVNIETAQVFEVRTAFEYELENGKIKNCWAFSNRRWGP